MLGKSNTRKGASWLFAARCVFAAPDVWEKNVVALGIFPGAVIMLPGTEDTIQTFSASGGQVKQRPAKENSYLHDAP